MSKNPHVLFITYGYPKNLGDIKYSFFREQAESLSDHGLKVGVLSSRLISLIKPSSLSFFPKIKYKTENNIDVVRCSWNKWIPFNEKYKINLLKYISNLGFNEYVKRNGFPDIIHNHSIVYSGFISEYISDKFKIPFLITEHNSGFHRGIYDFLLPEILRVCNKSSLCLAVSSNLALLLNKKIKNSSSWQTHNNLVSKSFFEEKLKKTKEKNFTFISIGNLIKEKNFSLLLKSFKNFNKIYPNSKLKIVGSGNQLNTLIKISKNLNIFSNVSFMGTLSRNEVIHEIKNSSVSVTSSNYETFGIFSAESLSLGKVVISTANMGCYDILNEKVGMIVQVNNESELTNAMISVFKNFKNYDSKKIRKYAYNKFSDDIITKKLISNYNKILLNN